MSSQCHSLSSSAAVLQEVDRSNGVHGALWVRPLINQRSRGTKTERRRYQRVNRSTYTVVSDATYRSLQAKGVLQSVGLVRISGSPPRYLSTHLVEQRCC